MSYGNHNGLHITRAISSENIGSVRVSQGAGSIGTQATNALGGTVESFSVDPADVMGGQGNLTYGSNETWRGFARLALGSRDGDSAMGVQGAAAWRAADRSESADADELFARLVSGRGEQ